MLTANRRITVTVCWKNNLKDSKVIFLQKNNFEAFLQNVRNKFRVKNVRVWTQDGLEITRRNIHNMKIEENMKILVTSEPGQKQQKNKKAQNVDENITSRPKENLILESPQKK